MFYVYILYSSKSDRYYVGFTGDVEQRVLDHNQGERSGQAKKYTYKHRPWVLKLSIPFQERSVAMKIEKYIKRQKSRRFIESLISARNNEAMLIDLLKIEINLGWRKA